MKSNNIILKTGISVLLCILVSKLLHLKYPFFVALPSFVPISNSAAESLKAGRNRMLGTLIGALVGLLFAYVQPGNAILCGLGISVIIYLCNYIRWGSSASIAGLVFISIMVSIKGENPVTYSIDRIANTFIGIILTLLVNNVLFRTNFIHEVEVACQNINSAILNLVKEKICSNRNIDFSRLDHEIEKVKDEINSYLQEYVLMKKNRDRIDQLGNITKELICISQHLKMVYAVEGNFTLNKQNKKDFNKLFNVDFHIGNYSDNEANIIFNYHLKRIFEKLSFVNDALTNNTNSNKQQ